MCADPDLSWLTVVFLLFYNLIPESMGFVMRGLISCLVIGRLMNGREGQVRFCGKAFALLLGGLFFFAAAIGQAQDVDWANTTGTPDPWFHDGDNWDGGVAPSSTDTVHFDQAGSYEVWWDDTTAATVPEVGNLDITDGEVVFLNTGDEFLHELILSGVSVTGTDPALNITASSPTLINRGLHLRSPSQVLIRDGGTLTLDGSHLSGAKLTSESIILLDGILNIEAGGKVVNSRTAYLVTYGIPPVDRKAGLPIATVTGTGSEWFAKELRVLQGRVNVEAGGVVNTEKSIINGSYDGLMSGIGRVTGVGSEWNAEDALYVGRDFGSGILEIDAGGVVNSRFTSVGYERTATGVITVSGEGSRLLNSKYAYVGYQSQGTLKIEEAGYVSSLGVEIGTRHGGTGLVEVTGVGSRLEVFEDFYVGGGGTLKIETGGVVSSDIGFVFGGSFPADGFALVSGAGSEWNNAGDLFIGNRDGGTLVVQDHGLVRVGAVLELRGQGTVRLEGGTIRAATLDLTSGTLEWTSGELSVDNFLGNLVQDAGTFSVGGTSSEKTVITGDYELSGDGTLAIELAATNAARGDLGLLEITGDATLGGTLDVALATGFVPTVGDAFEFLVAADVTNTFENVNLPTLPSEMSWALTYATESVVLTAVAVPEPATILLAACAMAGLVLRRERV